ncbi:MAG: 2-C-methyl-D-erythritol 4-phosphate cytidylyltransferase [Lachnospiraceae bacterium]|nr:2-C-methyl-D-erythritol 4-phosphate cytidylyltransferase [Lachnospiraceae bacterium]
MNIAIILAGGTGTRLGADIPKQYIQVNGKMILTYVLSTCVQAPEIDGIRIVCADMWENDIEADVRKHLTASTWKEKFMGYSEPGDNRQLSILHALEDIEEDIVAGHMASESINVMICDAARPNLMVQMIRDCFAALLENDGVMPALPMKDTIYRSEDGKIITSTLRREELFAGQAPEVFRFVPYYEACKALLPEKIYMINGSSEPAILAGMKIAMIPGDEKNYKITTQGDLERFREEK